MNRKSFTVVNYDNHELISCAYTTCFGELRMLMKHLLGFCRTVAENHIMP